MRPITFEFIMDIPESKILNTVDIDSWLADLLAKSREVFGARLLFLGLQGSYRRGEATAASDIDAVTIFDRLEPADLKAFRNIVDSLPYADKACGFICGRGELLNWPKHEIFQLRRETKAYWGDLEELTPEVGREDIVASVKIAAANIYHASGHTFVHGRGPAAGEILAGLYKTSFFVLQLLYYLRSGLYIETRAELLPLLSGPDREMLMNALELADGQSDLDLQALWGKIFVWSGAVLNEKF